MDSNHGWSRELGSRSSCSFDVQTVNVLWGEMFETERACVCVGATFVVDASVGVATRHFLARDDIH